MATSRQGELKPVEANVSILRELQGVVGTEYAREATDRDRVDRVQARFVVSPGSVEQAAAVMKLAHRANLAVSPVGGGSKLGWGNRPERVGLILRMERLNRVLEHAAGDLVMRAEAGASLTDVQSSLARAGQRLALDPPEPGATLGGIVVTNASGPLRHRFGTARDLLIGITYLLPDGTVARAGGKVVKNVAGYDLCKLFTGSLGTLGLIAETVFRLHPLPAASRSVIVSGFSHPDDLGAAVQTVLRSTLVPNAVDFAWGEGGELRVLFEGFEPGVVAQVESAEKLLSSYGGVRVAGHDAGEIGRTDDTATGADPSLAWTRLKISAPVAALPAVITAVRSLPNQAEQGSEQDHRIRGHAGAGITLVDMFGDAAMVADIERLRGAIGRLGGAVVVLQAPAPVKDALDVWGPVGDALPLMRRVKQMYDPTRIMNPGRFIGGL